MQRGVKKKPVATRTVANQLCVYVRGESPVTPEGPPDLGAVLYLFVTPSSYSSGIVNDEFMDGEGMKAFFLSLVPRGAAD